MNCEHPEIEESLGVRFCKTCGQEIPYLSFEPEWHCYENTEKDQARCLPLMKKNNRNIDKFVEKLHISESVKINAEQKYLQIVKHSTYRGNKRASIIAACVLFAYRENGEYKTADDIRKLFKNSSDITKKNMSYGLSKYYQMFKEDRVKHISPEKVLPKIMELAHVEEKFYPELLTTIQLLRTSNSSYGLYHQSSPQCIASAVVYHFLSLDKKDHRLQSNPKTSEALQLPKITKSDFSKLVGLSEITISKLNKEIEKTIESESQKSV